MISFVAFSVLTPQIRHQWHLACNRLIDWVVLHPTRHKNRSFRRRSSQPISWLIN